MANANPIDARRARAKKRAQAGNVADVKTRMWKAIEAACAVLDETEYDPALRLRAVHAVTQAAAAYTKVLESAEFEARLAALEEKVGHGSFF